MTVDEMVKIVGAFMTHCPHSYKMYMHSYAQSYLKKVTHGLLCSIGDEPESEEEEEGEEKEEEDKDDPSMANVGVSSKWSVSCDFKAVERTGTAILTL